ncbi:MAG: hypothetical protein Q27BPR15_15960 [Rhodobacter sp. CACIA14H1]|nr:MAG: hypothetical protein Q27BPR15_15960 [Rhodobacter sp. CACIA14H1]
MDMHVRTVIMRADHSLVLFQPEGLQHLRHRRQHLLIARPFLFMPGQDQMIVGFLDLLGELRRQPQFRGGVTPVFARQVPQDDCASFFADIPNTGLKSFGSSSRARLPRLADNLADHFKPSRISAPSA